MRREIKWTDKISGNAVFTTYFFSKENPQTVRGQIEADNIDYIKVWYESVNRLNLQGIVFHDGLSNDFIETYSTPWVKFVECKLGALSLNDERFVLYRMFIMENGRDLDWVLCTDGNDVIIQHDPFQFMEGHSRDKIYVGRNNGQRIRQSRFNTNKFRPFEATSGLQLDKAFYHQALYNAGILGGTRSKVMQFLDTMVPMLERCESGNNNMLVFNYSLHLLGWSNTGHWFYKSFGSLFSFKLYDMLRKVVYNRWTKFVYAYERDHQNRNDWLANTEKIFTSFPFCSKFKAFEKGDEFILIHK